MRDQTENLKYQLLKADEECRLLRSERDRFRQIATDALNQLAALTGAKTPDLMRKTNGNGMAH